MNKFLKSSFRICALLAVILALSVLLIYLLIEPRQFKPVIEKIVSGMTGSVVTVGEDLDFSLFPWVGVSISDINIENPEGFNEKHILTAKAFKVKVKLLPLFSGNVQVRQLVLDGLHLILERGRDGRLNFKETGASSKEAEVETKKEKDGGNGFSLRTLNVTQFAITNGSILWIDNLKGKRQQITGVTLRINDISTGKPIHFVLSGHFNEHPVTLEGNIGPLDPESITKKLLLDLSVRAMEKLKIKIQGEIKNPGKNLQYDLAVLVQPFSPRKLVADLGLEFPFKTPDPEVLNLIAIQAGFKGDVRNALFSSGAIDIDKSKLRYSFNANGISRPNIEIGIEIDPVGPKRFLPSKINIQGIITDFVENLQYDLAVKVSPFSPREFLAGLGLDFPLKTSDPEAFNLLSVRGDFKGDTRNTIVSSGVIDVDTSKLRYSFNAKDIAHPDVVFDLDLDQVDLNRFLPLDDQTKLSEKGKQSGDPNLLEKKNMFSLLGRAVFEGSAKAGQIRVKNLLIQDSYVKVKGKDGLITVDLVNMTCPGVGVKENVSGSMARQDPLKISMHGKITDIDTNPKYDMAVQVSPFSPRKFMSGLKINFPLKTADPEALGLIALKAEFKGDVQNKLISSGVLVIDKSKLRYSFNAKNISRPDITFDVDLDHIDMNRFLPPVDKSAVPKQGKSPGIAFLQRAVFDGAVNAGRIRIKKFLIKDTYAKISGKKGKIDLELVKMSCLGAKAKGKFSADLGRQAPRIKMNYKLTGARVEQFLKKLEVGSGINKIEGVLNLTNNVIAEGKSTNGLKKSLEGYVSLRSKKLVLHNLDLDKVLKKYEKSQNFGLLDIGSYFVLGPLGPLLTKTYDHASTMQSLGKGKSIVTRLVSDWKISRGIASAEDVAFSTEMNRVAVKGKIDIQEQTFNNLKIAIIDKNGCVKYVQTINGSFSKPEIQKASFVVNSIVRPLVTILKKGKDFITRSKCKVFYNGKVIHPLKK